MLYIKINGTIKTITSDSLKKELYSELFYNPFIYKIGDKIQDANRSLVVVDQFYYNKQFLYRLKCLKCGYIGVASNYDVVNHKYSCSCCYGKVVVVGINDIATTDPWMIEYFQNGKEEAQLYTHGSSAQIYFKCPSCNKISEKPRPIYWLYESHSLPCDCNDNISYPEKCMRSILEQLKIEYIYQLSKCTFTWCQKYRYDFYLPKYNMIIETHGMQHYDEHKTMFRNRNQKQIDNQKKQLALSHGIKYYIELDCSKSDINYIKNSIETNLDMIKQIPQIFKINWDEIEKNARKNIIKEVCNYYENEKHINTLAKIFHIDNTTVYKYLKIGTNIGWCNYPIRQRTRYKIQNDERIYIYKNNQLIGSARNAYHAKDICEEQGIRISVHSIYNAINYQRTSKGLVFLKGHKDLEVVV